MEYFLIFGSGFLLMASVIFAVGPQNAMLLRQGLRREHAFLVATIFTICDCALIALGVLGVGQIIAKIEILRLIIVWAGAAFLFLFAFKSLRQAIRGGQTLDVSRVGNKGTLIATAFAVSLLNPGAIIDTVVVIGSVSSKYTLGKALLFGFGAQVFSTMFFFGLAGFARKFSDKVNTPRAWQIIDLIVALIAFSIGLHLILWEYA